MLEGNVKSRSDVKPRDWQNCSADVRKSIIADAIDRTIRQHGDRLSDSQRNLLQAAFNDCGRGDYDGAFSFARTAEINLLKLNLKADGLTLFALQRQLDILRSMRTAEIS